MISQNGIFSLDSRRATNKFSTSLYVQSEYGRMLVHDKNTSLASNIIKLTLFNSVLIVWSLIVIVDQ